MYGREIGQAPTKRRGSNNYLIAFAGEGVVELPAPGNTLLELLLDSPQHDYVVVDIFLLRSQLLQMIFISFIYRKAHYKSAQEIYNKFIIQECQKKV